MQSIDQAPFSFSPTAGVVVACVVGFLVFTAALDLQGEQFRRVAKSPRGPAVGLIGQFVVLPAVAFWVGSFVETPSVALGLLLVACCPGGALSNYLTSVAKGDVATSVSMTAISTIASVVLTPLVFAGWASLNPSTSRLLLDIGIDVRRVVVVLMIMVVVPVAGGMFVRARRPELADRLRRPIRRVAMLAFAAMVVMVLGRNVNLLVGYAAEALGPVVLTFGVAATLGWTLARVARLGIPQRRAVTLEVALQNVGLALATAVAFFPSLTGVAVTGALWGVVHLTGGVALAAVWARVGPAHA